MDVFFNELSLKQADHPEIAKEWMMNLMTVYKTAYEKGFKGLRMPRSIAGELLAPDYTVAHWLNDRTVDQVVRLLFRSQANYPFSEDILSQKSSEGNRLLEFSHDKRTAKGLGLAFLFGSLAMSLNNDTKWDRTSIQIHASYFSDEDDLTESEEAVRHCSKADHLEILGQWIETLMKPSIPNGKILWLKRGAFFPNLFFCRAIKDQISYFHENHPEFIQIKKRLFELEAYCREWNTEIFDHGKISSKTTPEHDTRLEKFKDQLTILCPDGKKRLFSWHLRFTPGAGRIYIYPDEGAKKIYVGYIGRKLL